MQTKLIFAMLLLFPVLGVGQNTVSGTITDKDGTAWAAGKYVISFQPTPAIPNIAGQTVYSGSLDSSGAFSVSIPTASWNFTITPNATPASVPYGFSATFAITKPFRS